MLITMERIQAAADHIAEEFRADEIILFGSYAYGTPHDESDVDLLVILPDDGRVPDRIGAVYSAAHDVPLDIVVYDPDSVQQRLLWGDGFVHEIVQKGKCLFRLVAPPPA